MRDRLDFVKLKGYFNRWCNSKNVKANFDRLKQLILIKQFQYCVPDMRIHLTDNRAETVLDIYIATAADEYTITQVE